MESHDGTSSPEKSTAVTNSYSGPPKNLGKRKRDDVSEESNEAQEQDENEKENDHDGREVDNGEVPIQNEYKHELSHMQMLTILKDGE